MTISFKKPATTDVMVEIRISTEQVERLERTAENAGKADWLIDFELKDEKENVCCIVQGNFQMRKM